MKKFLSLVLALVMTMSLVTISAGAKDFTDNGKVTYKAAVDVVSELEIVDGYKDGYFAPATTLTRGAAAKIICNMILGPTTAGALPASVAPFKDVPANSTFAGYIAYCSQQGIINGYADGTFRPTATLNGYAFMKMLLGALGYDSKIEGYTGANWAVSVAKQALGIGLADDLSDAFNGSKAVTREEACLYAFNTLQADMVEYSDKGSSITVGGVEIVTNPSKATAVTTSGKSNTLVDEKADGANEDTVQFAERFFKDLEKKADFDAFDRPATTWVYDDEDVVTVADKADKTYTAAVKEKDLYDDVNMISTKNKMFTYTDGKKSATEYEVRSDSSTKLGGNGVLLEVFYDKKGNDNRIIMINTYIGEIDDVDKNDDKERIVSIGSMDFVTEEFEEDDMVLYTMDVTAAAADKIQTMVAAEKMTGTLTKKTGDSEFVIGGTTYKGSMNIDVDPSVDVKDDVDFYLDSYGYILQIDEAEDNDSVENLAYVIEAKDSCDAKLLFADGKTKNVDTDKLYNEMDGHIVSFKPISDDEYKLTDKSSAKISANDTIKFEKGKTLIDAATDVRTDSKTVFVVISGTDPDYNAYVGYKNAPSITGDGSATDGVVAYTKSGKTAATMVVIKVDKADLKGSSADLTFVAGDKDLDVIDDGDSVTYYEFNAVVDGKITTVKINTTAGQTLAAANAVGVMNQVSYDSDDIGTPGSAPTTGTNPSVTKDYYTATISERESNDTLVLGGYSLAYVDGVKVFVVDGDTITEGSLSDIREDNDGTKNPFKNIFYTLDDGKVDMVVLEKA